MSLVKPRPIVALPYKSKLKQQDLLKILKLLNDYRKFPHFSLRDEILEFIDQLRAEAVDEALAQEQTK